MTTKYLLRSLPDAQGKGFFSWRCTERNLLISQRPIIVFCKEDVLKNIVVADLRVPAMGLMAGLPAEVHKVPQVAGVVDVGDGHGTYTLAQTPQL